MRREALLTTLTNNQRLFYISDYWKCDCITQIDSTHRLHQSFACQSSRRRVYRGGSRTNRGQRNKNTVCTSFRNYISKNSRIQYTFPKVHQTWSKTSKLWLTVNISLSLVVRLNLVKVWQLNSPSNPPVLAWGNCLSTLTQTDWEMSREKPLSLFEKKCEIWMLSQKSRHVHVQFREP